MKKHPVACALLLAGFLAAPNAFAEDRILNNAPVNGFRPLTPAELLPGQIVSLDDADERRRATLPPPCTGRSRKGVETGTWVGAIAGLIAGIAAGDAQDDKWEKAGKGLAGMAIGSTAGYVAGRVYNGDRDCPGMKNEMPNVRRFTPMVDEIAWEERRRALAGGP